MIPVHTRVLANVAGNFDWLKEPESLQTSVRHALARDGQVISVRVDTALFSNQYTATVEYITGTAHASIDDVRTFIAGVFQDWNGEKPSVAILKPATGDTAAPKVHSPFLPDGFDFDAFFGNAKWLLWGAVALIVVVNVAPALRR